MHAIVFNKANQMNVYAKEQPHLSLPTLHVKYLLAYLLAYLLSMTLNIHYRKKLIDSLVVPPSIVSYSHVQIIYYNEHRCNVYFTSANCVLSPHMNVYTWNHDLVKVRYTHVRDIISHFKHSMHVYNMANNNF